MKKLTLCILVIIVLTLSLNSNDINVFASSKEYARISQNGCYLYKNPSDNPNIDNIWCELENTYFVELIVEDYNNTFSKINYNSIIGFAKKDCLRKIINVPSMPYPSGINIKINSNNGCYLRENPISKTNTNNIIKTLNKGTDNILFIGYIKGDEGVDLKGNLWYLVKHGNDIGYMYSDFAESKVTIYPNLEEVSFINNNISSTLLNPLTNTTTLIIVIAILTPSVLIMILLFLPKRKTAKIRKKGEPIKEIDYSEISDIYNDVDKI